MVFNECKVVDEGLMNIMFVFFSAIKLKTQKITGFSLLHDLDSIQQSIEKYWIKPPVWKSLYSYLSLGNNTATVLGCEFDRACCACGDLSKKSPRWLLSICVDFVTRKDTCISKRRENVSCKNIYLGSFQTTDPWNSTSKDLCQCANPLGQGSNNPLLSQWQLFSVHRTHVRSMAARSFQCAQGDSCF